MMRLLWFQSLLAVLLWVLPSEAFICSSPRVALRTLSPLAVQSLKSSGPQFSTSLGWTSIVPADLAGVERLLVRAKGCQGPPNCEGSESSLDAAYLKDLKNKPETTAVERDCVRRARRALLSNAMFAAMASSSGAWAAEQQRVDGDKDFLELRGRLEKSSGVESMGPSLPWAETQMYWPSWMFGAWQASTELKAVKFSEANTEP
mmetsp:Transcript_12862/g.20213  ORF Transcript_12862/g.20213 Transcript_12862/m.20213 type:complete len:204 (-) Transcript_12862:888-1499(-)